MSRVLLAIAALVLAVGSAHAADGDRWRDGLAADPPPWYDQKADDWRRIEPPEPDKPEVEPESTEGHSSGITMPSATVVAVLLLSALVLAAAWVVWQLHRLAPPPLPEAQTGRPAPRAAPDLSSLPLPDAGLPPEEGLRRALEAGDWRRAVVWIHARLLLRLDAAGVLRLERGATERSLLTAAKEWAAGKPARNPAALALQRTGSAFAAVYFGHATADRRLVDALLASDASAERTLASEAER